MLWERPCVPRLWNVCNQSNGMTKRHGRGDVETRELKSASGTSNVSFCVFSKHSVCNVSVIFTVVCLSVTITSKWRATDSPWERVSFSTCADLLGVNARGRCVVCLGTEQQSQLSRESCTTCSHKRKRSAHAGHTSRSVSVFAVFAIPVLLLLRHGGDRVCGDCVLIYAFSFWVRVLCSVPSSKEVDVVNIMNCVLAISIFLHMKSILHFR